MIVNVVMVVIILLFVVVKGAVSGGYDGGGGGSVDCCERGGSSDFVGMLYLSNVPKTLDGQISPNNPALDELSLSEKACFGRPLK